MTVDRRIAMATVLCCGIAGMACNREAGKLESNTGGVAKRQAAADVSSRRTGADRNACDLLTIEEATAAAGVPVTATEMSYANGPAEVATATNRVKGTSACWWEDTDGQARLAVTAYWTDGKRWWDINGAARGMARGIVRKQEGVTLDSVVKAGFVSGLGDKAFFSPLLQSLVLKGDVLLEITMSVLPKPEAQFRPLVTKMLSRL